jgi:hypothetical protein
MKQQICDDEAHALTIPRSFVIYRVCFQNIKQQIFDILFLKFIYLFINFYKKIKISINFIIY